MWLLVSFWAPGQVGSIRALREALQSILLCSVLLAAS